MEMLTCPYWSLLFWVLRSPCSTAQLCLQSSSAKDLCWAGREACCSQLFLPVTWGTTGQRRWAPKTWCDSLAFKMLHTSSHFSVTSFPTRCSISFEDDMWQQVEHIRKALDSSNSSTHQSYIWTDNSSYYFSAPSFIFEDTAHLPLFHLEYNENLAPDFKVK